ncbi:MAG: dihydrolipoamide acetyltransferase family protein, partial [Anaerolineae bacterium]
AHAEPPPDEAIAYRELAGRWPTGDQFNLMHTAAGLFGGHETVQALKRLAPQPVLSAAPVAASPAAGQTVPMAGVRARIAERMSASSQQTARVTLTAEVDATHLVEARTALKDAFAQELGFAVGYNDLLIAICARALREFPYMNARLEGDEIRLLEEVHIGLAVDTERGLLVPVLRDADRLRVVEIARVLRELVARVRAGKAGPDDLTGGTFTITNLGMYGVDAFTPIINLPECAILGVGRIKPQPAVVAGQVTIRQMLWLSLTFDHRLVDGAPAARFLQRIVQLVEEPFLLLA